MLLQAGRGQIDPFGRRELVNNQGGGKTFKLQGGWGDF